MFGSLRVLILFSSLLLMTKIHEEYLDNAELDDEGNTILTHYMLAMIIIGVVLAFYMTAAKIIREANEARQAARNATMKSK